MRARTGLRAAYVSCALMTGLHVFVAIGSLVVLNPIGAGLNIAGATVWSLLSDRAAEKMERGEKQLGRLGEVQP